MPDVRTLRVDLPCETMARFERIRRELQASGHAETLRALLLHWETTHPLFAANHGVIPVIERERVSA